MSQKRINYLADKENLSPEELEELIELLRVKLVKKTITQEERSILYVAMVIHGDIEPEKTGKRRGMSYL